MMDQARRVADGRLLRRGVIGIILCHWILSRGKRQLIFLRNDAQKSPLQRTSSSLVPAPLE